MRTLSLWQPWAWLVAYGGKDIENRDWPTDYRGPVLIHASKRKMTAQEIKDLSHLCWRHDLVMPALHDIRYGGVVARADLVDCVTESDSKWFAGPYGFVLANVRPTVFLPVRGQQGFFFVSEREVQLC